MLKADLLTTLAFAVVVVTPPVALAGTSYEVIHTFNGTTDGGAPAGGVTMLPDGSLVGATTTGGANGTGTLFVVSPPSRAGGHWGFKVAHAIPSGYGVVTTSLSSDGLNGLYGVISVGYRGPSQVFELQAPRAGQSSWAFTTLADVTTGSAVLRGVTFARGQVFGANERVFRLTPPTSGLTAWRYQSLYSLAPLGSEGATAPPIARYLDGRFTLFGTKAETGAATIYSLQFANPPFSKAGTFSVLHTFPSGDFAADQLIADRSLNLFGTTYRGQVFRLQPPAANRARWAYDVLQTFSSEVPMGPPAADDQGRLYGIVSDRIFRLTPRDYGGHTLPWNVTTMHEFGGGNRAAGGYAPDGPLTISRDSDGAISIYGTTFSGGAPGAGIVFHVRVTQ